MTGSGNWQVRPTPTDLPCLLVRQPYASLIAYGLKRIEFRKYPTRVRGRIGIAASKGPPLQTLDTTINSVSMEWPRGFVLATATLSRTEFWDQNMLGRSAVRQRDILVHGTSLRVYDSPLGEPTADVDTAIGRGDWQSWAWIMQDVQPLRFPKEYVQASRSSWAKVLIE